jgi:parallel beta-helix repeat protein
MSSGICVFSSNNNLSHNIVRYNSYGIWLDNSTHSTVHGNSVFSNGFGVCLEDSNGNTISQNEVFSNSIDGIFLLLSHSNAIPSNNVSSNIDTGIYLMGSENNTISGNFAIDNGNGIFLEGSNHNLVYYNNASCNAQPPAAGIGINLRHSSNCAVSGNIALNNTYGTSVNWQSYENLISDNVYSCNDYGIDLAVYVANNTVCRNTVSRNNHGIYLADGSSNINTFFHNNFIDNIQNAEAYSLGIWDNGCEGNYWSDYEDKHPSANYDQYGIWNTSYLINTEGVDRYPLRNPYWNVGDLNRDLKVDIFDLVLMCACYCLDWQAHMCHVDTAKPYGVINIFDVVTVAINYGKEYSP